MLDSWKWKDRRVQQKIPYPLMQDDNIEVTAYLGPNVTMVQHGASGQSYVYKEYCYHLRERSSVLLSLIEIEQSDKRKPPSSGLLTQLGSPYADWKVYVGPFGISVLCYPMLEGSSYKPSVAGWAQILGMVRKMHEIDYVHGDLLPRNVLFGAHSNGYLIDFDLSRKIGASYVSGYNNEDFTEYRHRDARAGHKMRKEHDIHSLREMSKMFFDCRQADINDYSINQLIRFFESDSSTVSPNILDEAGENEASGSSQRPYF